MRDPNSEAFKRCQRVMASGDMTGTYRPVGRITVGRNRVVHVETEIGKWYMILFGQPRQVELLGVQSIQINRSVGQDAATCTITMANDAVFPGQYSPEGIDTGLMRPGNLSYDRGQKPRLMDPKTGKPYQSVYNNWSPWEELVGLDEMDSKEYPTDWGYPLPEGWQNIETETWSFEYVYEGGSGADGPPDARWLRGGGTADPNGLLIPNRVIRTFQGYGSDNYDENGELKYYGDDGYVHPLEDNQLFQTGVWMIDAVNYGTDGMITIECRDIAKLLINQYIYPPQLPLSRFPLKYGPGNAPGTPAIPDWSDAIKELVCWAGFTWRAEQQFYGTVPPDPRIGRDLDYPNELPMRAWGDFEVLGAGPVEETKPDIFLQKSFMEGVNLIKDMLGCIFFVADDGGAIFRLPNIYGGGNFINDSKSHLDLPYLRNEWPIELHENAGLLNYSVRLDDSQLRSEVLVIGGDPDTYVTGPVAGGWEPGQSANASLWKALLAGQKRLMVVPHEHSKGFNTTEEVQRMAELTALKILFTFRRGEAESIAHPGLHVDDQITIFERVTNERNVHYVSGISTNMDLVSGTYTMNLTTHWLGPDPNADWFVLKQNLTEAVLGLDAVKERMGL